MKIDQLNILALGRNPEIMLVMNRLLNAPAGWYGVTASTEEEVMAAFAVTPFHIVLLCAGVTPAEEVLLKEKLQAMNPAVIVQRHYGGGSGLLNNEIKFVLEQENIQLAS